jgi:hypothetical protein
MNKIDLDEIEIKENKTKNEMKNIDYENISQKGNDPTNIGYGNHSGNTYNNNPHSNFEISQEHSNNDLNPPIEKFKVPSNLKKTFFCSLALFALGCTLIGIGFIRQIILSVPGLGITFWVLGGIVLIPGGYYSYQFYKAKKSQSEEEREEILENIPEL